MKTRIERCLSGFYYIIFKCFGIQSIHIQWKHRLETFRISYVFISEKLHRVGKFFNILHIITISAVRFSVLVKGCYWTIASIYQTVVVSKYKTIPNLFIVLQCTIQDTNMNNKLADRH